MRLLTALIPLTLAAALSSPAFAAGSMQITGHGEIMAAPDTAYVTSGVTSQGTTAREALDANTADMSAVIAALKAAGIDSADIQTSGFSVSPNYVYSDARDANGYQLPPKIVGYTVSNGVTVHVRDLASLGAVLDQAVTVGANTISGITFAVEDPAGLYNEARKAAFADAKGKADLYAEAAGVELGALALISEQLGGGQPQPYMFKAEVAMADRSAPVPIEAGQLTFTIDVNVNWDLEPGR
ncbi:MAG: SIMPL domain-containing protein [Devosia nanyangense]|uniref:SIMPL domain-containing protein n=1 Tax=Devosia nanyangense TaxID=1228055 RepID=A0A933L0F7_9HYPH|nr:SIMPL domain-containing protein [Devosia nanyangense]